MGARKSPDAKRREGYGKGSGKDYKAYETAREHTGSYSTRSIEQDWITGRSVNLLSQAERKVWLYLRFNPNVVDIREQKNLDKSITDKIRSENGWPVSSTAYDMSTDFLVTYRSGKTIAISVKTNKKDIENNLKTLRSLFVEKQYWTEYVGVQWTIVYADELNSKVADNIYLVTRYYDAENVFDKVSAMKHLIATHQFELTKEEMADVIDYRKLAELNLSEKAYNDIRKLRAKKRKLLQ